MRSLRTFVLFHSGGTEVTVIGSQLDSVAEPYIRLTVYTTKIINNVTFHWSNSSSEVGRLTANSLKTLSIDYT